MFTAPHVLENPNPQYIRTVNFTNDAIRISIDVDDDRSKVLEILRSDFGDVNIQNNGVIELENDFVLFQRVLNNLRSKNLITEEYYTEVSDYIALNMFDGVSTIPYYTFLPSVTGFTQCYVQHFQELFNPFSTNNNILPQEDEYQVYAEEEIPVFDDFEPNNVNEEVPFETKYNKTIDKFRISDSFIDPKFRGQLSGQVMDNPIFIHGVWCEREFVAKWVKEKKRDPYTREKIGPEEFYKQYGINKNYQCKVEEFMRPRITFYANIYNNGYVLPNRFFPRTPYNLFKVDAINENNKQVILYVPPLDFQNFKSSKSITKGDCVSSGLKRGFFGKPVLQLEVFVEGDGAISIEKTGENRDYLGGLVRKYSISEEGDDSIISFYNEGFYVPQKKAMLALKRFMKDGRISEQEYERLVETSQYISSLKM